MNGNTLDPMLTALQQRLEAAYRQPPANQLPLDGQTLDTTDGADIIALVREYLHIDLNTDSIVLEGDAISITPDPAQNTLTVTNCISKTPLVEVVIADVNIVFGVAENKLTIKMTFGDQLSWEIQDSFPFLGESFFANLRFSDDPSQIARFTLSSLPVPGPVDTLPAGLHLTGHLFLDDSPVSTLVSLITGIQQPVTVAGPVRNDDPTSEKVEIMGRVPDFRLPLSILPGLSFQNPAFGLFGYYQDTLDIPRYTQFYFRAQSDVTLAGVSLPLAVQLPGKLKGWQILLVPGRSVPVGNIATFLGAFLGIDLPSLLPRQVAALNCFELQAFNLALTGDRSDFKRLDLAVGTIPAREGESVWAILPGIIELTKLGVSLSVQKDTSVVYSGLIQGGFRLGSKLYVQADIVLPTGTGNWTFSAYSNQPFGLADLAQLMGGKSLADMLPAGLGQLTSILLENLQIVYDPAGNTLVSFYLSIKSAYPWVIIANQLEINNVFLRMTVNSPLSSAAAVFGSVGGTIAIGSAEVHVTVGNDAANGPWVLEVVSESIPLPTISDLANLAGTDITYLVPTSLQTARFVLSDLAILVDISARQLNQLNLTLGADLNWELIPNVLTIEKTYVMMRLSRLTTELYSSVYIYGEFKIVNTTISISALRSFNGDWTFRGELAPGETVDLVGMVTQLLGITAKLPLQLEVEGIAVTIQTNNETNITTYSIEGQTAGYWEYVVSSFLTLKMKAAVYFERKSDGTSSGSITGDFFINSLEIRATYQFDANSKTLIFAIIYKRLSLTASLTSGTDAKGNEYSLLTFRMGDLSLGEILEYLVNLAAPDLDFKLPAPWDALNQINFKDLSLVVDLKTRKVTVNYDINVNLVFIDIKSIGFTYENAAGKGSVKLAFSGRFLDQEYSIEDNNPLEWDVVNESPPAVPAEGPELLDLRYVGLGQHVSFTDTKDLDSVSQVITALKEQMKPPKDASQNPLAEGNGSLMRFDSDSHILFGLDFEVLKTVSLSGIFNDPYLYGMLVSLAGERAGSFAGLSFELLYKRITNDIGVFKIELRVPDAFRQLEFGEVSVTLPIIKVDIYTNGNFRVDLGFPHGGNFDDSFCLQVFPFIGYGGFYFAALTGETSDRVPRISNGTFNPVIEFGIGLNVGLGKDIRKGVLKAGASITLEAILEGVAAWFTPNDKAVSDAKYYWVQGTAGIIGKVYGEVDFKVIKVNVSVVARATVTLTIEAYEPIIVELTASVEAKASVKILFIKVHFSFKLEVDLGFVIGHKSTPPWILAPASEAAPAPAPAGRMRLAAAAVPVRTAAGQPQLRMQRGLHRKKSRVPYMRAAAYSAPPVAARAAADTTTALTWTPVAVFDSIQPVVMSLLPTFTVVTPPATTPPTPPPSPELEVAMLMFAESSIPPDAVEIEETAAASVDHSASANEPADAPFNLLLRGMLAWSVNALLGRHTGNITRADLARLYNDLEKAETEQEGFSYDNLAGFIGLNYEFRVSGVPDNFSDANDLSAAVFPMIPDLSMTPKDRETVNFKTYNRISHKVSHRYEVNIEAYYKQLMVDYNADRAADPLAAGDAAGTVLRTAGADDEPKEDSMAMKIFRDNFLMMAKSAVQAAMDIMDNFAYDVGEHDSLDTIASAANFPPIIMPYEVQPGDTIASISEEFGMTEQELQDLNGGNLSDPLTPGTTLQVQIAVTPASIALANSDVVLRNSTSLTLNGLLYQVKTGNSLDFIKTRFTLGDTEDLFENIPENAENTLLLKQGSAITIAGPKEKGDNRNDDYSYFIYTSAAGDHLDAIAVFVYVRNLGPGNIADPNRALPWYEQTITDLNTDPQNPYAGPDLVGVIAAGTTLNIPGAFNDSDPAHAVTYVTREGDTLALVAGYYLVLQNQPTVLDDLKTALRDLNDLDWSNLPVGTRVKVPARTHTIGSGETFASLAALFRVTVSDLTGSGSPNASDENLLSPLAVMKLPPVTHVIGKDGSDETFAAIAANYNITAAELAEDIAAVPDIFPYPMDNPLNIPDVPQYNITRLIKKVVTQKLANQAAASISRFMLHGLRLPDPKNTVFTGMTPEEILSGAATMVELYGLYHLSGQQLPCPDTSALPYDITFDKDTGAGWLKFVNAMISQPGDTGDALKAQYPDIEQLNPAVDFSGDVPPGLLLLTGYTDQLTVSLTNQLIETHKPSTTFEPEIVSGPSVAPLYNLSPVKYGLQQNIHWQTTEPLSFAGTTVDDHPSTGEPTIWMFTGALLRKIASFTSGTTDFGLFSTSSRLLPADRQAPPSLNLYNWASMMEIKIRQISSSTAAGGVLSNSYELVGASQEDRDRMLFLWTHLEDAGDDETGTEIHILYQPNADSNNNKGLASQPVSPDSTFLLKANLSTLTTSGARARKRAAGTAEEGDEELEVLYQYSATIANPASFLKLLWEGCVTGTGGYTLHYEAVAGKAGLPNQIFAAGTEGTLKLMVFLYSQTRQENPVRKLYYFNNCAVIGDNVDPAGESVFAEITQPGVDNFVKMAAVPPGNVGFDLIRKNPDYESPTTDPEKQEQRTRALYSLLGFHVLDEGLFAASNEGLPAGPLENKDDQTHWHFHQVLAAAPLAKSHSLPDCGQLPGYMQDPYAGIGKDSTVCLGFAFHDVLGNSTTSADPLTNLDIPMGYIDNLVAFGQWPGIASFYHVNPTNTTLSVQAELQVSNYTAGPGSSLDTALYNASTHLTRYKKIYYQVWQPDVTMSLSTSLNQASESADPHEYDVDKVPLANFVSASYVFLNTALQQQPVTRPIAADETFFSIASQAPGAAPGLPGECPDNAEAIALACINAPGLMAEIIALGRANQNVPCVGLFTAPLTIPGYYLMAYGDTLSGIVDGQGVTVQQFARNNQDVPLNAGIIMAAPTRTTPATAAGNYLADMADTMKCSVANIAETNAAVRGILSKGKTLTVNNVAVQVELVGSPAESESFNDLVTKFAALNQVVTPADIAVANQELTDIFVTGKELNITDYVIQNGDTFYHLSQTYPEFTVDALSDAAKNNANVFPSGASLYLKDKTPVSPSAADTLASLADVYGLDLEQLVLFNQCNVLVEGKPLILPDQVRIDAGADGVFAPYTTTAGLSLKTIADRFGEADTRTFAQRNRALGYVFIKDQTIAVGPTASTQTQTDDSMNSVLERLQSQDNTVTFDQLVTAIENSTTLVVEGAFFICLLPSTGSGGKLTHLGTTFNVNAAAIAQANASLTGLIAPGKDVTVKNQKGNDQTLTTRENDTFSSLVTRFYSQYELQTTVAELAAVNAGVPGLMTAAIRFMLPPKAVRVSAEMGADYPKNPTFPGTIFKVITQLIIRRDKDLAAPDFRDVEPVKVSRSVIAPVAVSGKGSAALSLKDFAVDFETTFPHVKVATGRSEPETAGSKGKSSGARQVWAVDFGPGGIHSVTISGAQPSFFAIKPLANKLKDKKQVPIRTFNPNTGKLEPEDDPEKLDFQAIDMEVWAGIFLAGVELILSPEYAVPAYQQNASAFDRIVAAKKSLAEKISTGVENILATPSPSANPGDAQERVKQELMVNLASGYATDAVIQYPAAVGSPFSAPAYSDNNAPFLSGQPAARVYKTGDKDGFADLAGHYHVSQVSIAALLANVGKILHVGVNVSFKGTNYKIKTGDTIAALAAAVGADGYQDLVDNLKTPDGLFAVETTINIYNTRTTAGATSPSPNPEDASFESLVVYFNAALENIVLANQETGGIFKNGVTIEIEGHDPQTVNNTNNSLVKMSALMGITPLELALGMWAQTGKLNPTFTVYLVRIVPEFNLSSAKTSMFNGTSTVNLLFNVKSKAHSKKLFLDLNYRINEMEYDIRELPGTGGYSASHWLSFIIPIDSAAAGSPVLSTELGQVEIPIPLRSYPPASTLVAQSGTASNKKPTTVTGGKQWNYTFGYQHQSAEQDDIYLKVIFNEPEELLKAGRLTAQPDLFSNLAQFVSAYPEVKTKLTGLLTAETVDPVLAETVSTFADMVEWTARTWGYPAENFEQPGTPGQDFATSDEYDYQVGFTVKEGANKDDYLLNKFTLKLVADPGGHIAGSPSPSGSFPEVYWADTEGGQPHPLTKESETDKEAVYCYKEDVPAFTPLRHQLVFPGMDVTVVQNANAGTRVTRNQQLISTGKTAYQFVYTTPLVVFNNLLTPFISHANTIFFKQGQAGLQQALTDLFTTLLGDNATDFKIKVSVQFGYELVKPAAGDSDSEPIISLLPILFRPTQVYSTSLPGDLAGSIDTWHRDKPFGPNQGLYVFDITVYSTMTTSSQIPILELKELVYENSDS